MLSGRGIDGELKSKFGEWSEKFWQSGVMNGNLRAIYLTNGGGRGDGGKKLNELKGGDGRQMISTESGDKVKSVFGICTNGQNGGGCQGNNNNSSVVLVGDDPNVNASMTWEKLKEQNWGQTSLVRSGYKYPNLFNKNIWKGTYKGEESKLNRQKVQSILSNQGRNEGLKRIMCPWVWDLDDRGLTRLENLCRGFNPGSSSQKGINLANFLNSNSAKEYFDEKVWSRYGDSWRFIALLTLLDLWMSNLIQINFDQIGKIFNESYDSFKLNNLINKNGELLLLQQATTEQNIESVTYHSGGVWAVQLCPNSSSCSNDNGLNLTLGNGKFCVVKDVCFSGNDSHSSISGAREKWASLQWSQQAGGLWTTIIGSKSGAKLVRDLFISLVAASFSDVKGISLSINANPEKGRMLLKKLN